MYKIVRFYRERGRRPRTIKTRLTLEQAQTHCQRPDTRGGIHCEQHGPLQGNPQHCPKCGQPTLSSWFDGYVET